jgi:glutathione synthase/RimK-type ligase-like ATP-grasp enzyme
LRIALLGSPEDAQVQSVGRELDDRGADCTVWDADAWPGKTPLWMEQAGTETRIRVGEDVVDPDELDAVYLRRMGFDPRVIDREDDEFDERPIAVLNQYREYRGLLRSVLMYLEEAGVRVVNPPGSSGIHANKPYQLSQLAEAGVPVPETLAANDPERVRAFVDRIDDAIYKPVGGGGQARPVGQEDLTDDRLGRLANAPVQFQERVDGDDVRVFVIGGEAVAAARILSDDLDYRDSEEGLERYEIGPDIAETAVRAAGCFDLAFTAVDVLVDGDDFAVLEANPSPMFAGFDAHAGTDVAGHLAEYLCS